MTDPVLVELLEIREQLKVLSDRVERIIASKIGTGDLGEARDSDGVHDEQDLDAAELCTDEEAEVEFDGSEIHSLFMPDDSELQEFEIRELVRWIFPTAIREGRLSEEDVKFLRLWDSGTFFQGAPVPILFPYDEEFSDISLWKTYRVWYFKDISIDYGGAKYRLLAHPYHGRCVPVILNWFLKRGFARDELIGRYSGRLMMGGTAKGAPVDLFADLMPGKRNIIGRRHRNVKQAELSLEKDCSAELMAKVLRADGSVAASDVKTVLNRQLKKHMYTPRNFSAGTGIEWAVVKSWLRGELLIRADELAQVCKFLGVDNLFQGV